MGEMSYIIRVLHAGSVNSEDVLWEMNEEDKSIVFFVNCNDVFAWGSSDAEKITEDNIYIFEKACNDAKNSCDDGYAFAGELFCCRIRKASPQKGFMKVIPKDMRQLFEECGPSLTYC